MPSRASDHLPVSRRQFLSTSTAVALAPAVVASSAVARGARAPSNRITLGFIGLGKMNLGHLRYFLRQEDTQVLAVCEVDTTRREHARKLVEKYYDEQKNTSAPTVCTAYNDFRELLARSDIDGVVIATPDHWHAVQIIAAARAGKDIYCEKPLTLTIAEAPRVIDVVREQNRVFQTGSQQRSEFGGRFRQACELIRSGRIGKVRTVYVGVGGPSKWCDLPAEDLEPGLDWDLWLGPAPERAYNSVLSPRGMHDHFPAWRHYREYSGGAMTDIGAHHFDIAQWALDMDRSGPVEMIPPEHPERGRGVKYLYANGVEMYHGGPSGVTFLGDGGMLRVDRGEIYSDPKGILEEPLAENEVHLFRSPGHKRNWLDCIKSREQPVCHAEVGARSVTVCHLGNLAYWHGRRLRWDPRKWTFVDDPEANQWLDVQRRGPWSLA